MEISKKFLNAAKYRALQDSGNVAGALSTLLEDIGTGPVQIKQTPKNSTFRDPVIASVEDVGLTYTTSEQQVNGIGPLVGNGKNADAAMNDLLNKLLTPEKQMPPEYQGDPHLIVLQPKGVKPMALIKIKP